MRLVFKSTDELSLNLNVLPEQQLAQFLLQTWALLNLPQVNTPLNEILYVVH